MIKLLTSISAIALVLTTSACGTSDAPAENIAANEMNAMTADPADSFVDSELAMDKAMAAAVGTSAADNWVRKMIEHHRGALDMSRIALAGNVTGDVAKMAQVTIDKQGKEITDLEKLVATGTPDPVSAELYKPAAMTMHSAMMAAKGTDLAQTYLRKMLAHHQGAVAMSEVALANGATGAVRAQIEKTKADQQMEVAMVEAMLRGEPMMTMAPAAASAPASDKTAPKAATKVVAPAKPAPTPAKPTPAKPAADPHAGMDMNNM